MSEAASIRLPLCIAPAHPCLPGHFPGQPVVPGVILCEMMAQACCVLLAEKQKDLTVVSVSVSRSDVEEAHALGTSAGKLYLVEQLQKSSDGDGAFDTEDWIEKPVREIMKKTQEEQDQSAPQGTGDEEPSGGQGEPSGGPKATSEIQPEPSASPDLPGQGSTAQPQDSPNPQDSKKGSPAGGTKPGSGGQPRG